MDYMSILDASKQLGVTKQAIYRKLKDNENKELQEQIHQGEKGKMLSNKGLEILKGIFSGRKESKQEQSAPVTDNSKDLLIDSLEKQIENLKYQLETSNRLLENQQKITSQLLLTQGNAEDKSKKWWKFWSQK